MRNFLSQGNPEKPLLLYVGRISTEKRLHRLKKVLDSNPGARLAMVGLGPQEESMKAFFRDYPVFFVGKLEGIVKNLSAL
jgi:glycosyltransferase involved in cell wall biosynthesis